MIRGACRLRGARGVSGLAAPPGSGGRRGPRPPAGLHAALGPAPTWSIAAHFLPPDDARRAPDADHVAHLAQLAGIAVPRDQLPRLAREFDALARLVGSVRGADVGGVEPLVSFAREGRNAEGAWLRDDEEDGGGPKKDWKGEPLADAPPRREHAGTDLLRHASKLDRDFFVVKRPVQGTGDDER